MSQRRAISEDLCHDDAFNACSHPAQNLFVRLLVNADACGIVPATLHTLKVKTGYLNDDIYERLQELVNAGLGRVIEYNGKPYWIFKRNAFQKHNSYTFNKRGMSDYLKMDAETFEGTYFYDHADFPVPEHLRAGDGQESLYPLTGHEDIGTEPGLLEPGSLQPLTGHEDNSIGAAGAQLLSSRGAAGAERRIYSSISLSLGKDISLDKEVKKGTEEKTTGAPKKTTNRFEMEMTPTTKTRKVAKTGSTPRRKPRRTHEDAVGKANVGETAVRLTPQEFEALRGIYGSNQRLDAGIQILDDYLANSKRRYMSHYRVLRGWVLDRVKERELLEERHKKFAGGGKPDLQKVKELMNRLPMNKPKETK